MEIPTKAKNNIQEGTIELEGSESFVTKYIDQFKEKIKVIDRPLQVSRNSSPYISQDKKIHEENKNKNKKSSVKNIEIEEFDIDGDKSKKVPSLKEFFESKNPGKSAPNRIIVIGYYVTKCANLEEFSEGHIEYGYKALNLTGRPAHLRQIIINKKNEKKWFNKGTAVGKWTLNRIGEIYVDEHLPETKENE